MIGTQTICPECGRENLVSASHCATCGASLTNDAASEIAEAAPATATTPPSFPSELLVLAEELRKNAKIIPQKTTSAYAPSGVSPAGSIKFIVQNGVVGAAGGIFCYVIGSLTASIFALGLIQRSSGGQTCFLLLLFGSVSLFLILYCPGLIVGWMSGLGAKLGKNRSNAQVSKIAAVIALGGISFPLVALYGVFGKMVGVVLPEPTEYQAAENMRLFLTIPGVFLSPVIAYLVAQRQVKSQKFCEICQQYMKRSLLLTLPLEATGETILYFLTWDLPKLSAIEELPKAAENRSEMNLWSCSCHQTNYLELLAHGKMGDRKFSDTLVFSATIGPEHAKALEVALQSD